jgi:Domain of unknown function (DUF1906)
LITRPATEGLWCDTATPIDFRRVKYLKAEGFVGVFRYLPLPGNDTSCDLSRDEVQLLLGEGLEIGLVQHVRGRPPYNPEWHPSEHSGATDGAHAATHALNVCGLPEGAHIFQDLEATDGNAPNVWEYSVAWAERGVLYHGFRAGLYVGFSAGLPPRQLYELPHDSYWSDAAHRLVSVRGCAVNQGKTRRIVGIHGPAGDWSLDEDAVRKDQLGQVPYVVALC